MSFLRPSPRTSSGNELTPIVDAETGYRELLSAIKAAKRFVYIATWGFDPGLEMTRTGSGDEKLGELLLARAKEGIEIKVLVWDFLSIGHPFGTIGDIFRPDLRDFKRELAAAGAKAKKGTALFLTQNPARPPGRRFVTGTDHQKFWMVDEAGKHPIGFVGGMNLGQHEWDTSDHTPGDRRRTAPGLNRQGLELQDALKNPFAAPFVRRRVEQELETRFQLSQRIDQLPIGAADKAVRRQQAVDLAIEILKKQKPLPARHDVTSRIRGPAAAEVLEEFRARWRISGSGSLGEKKASIATPAGAKSTVQVLHTAHFSGPGGQKDIWRAYLHALKQAERFIYLENQYFTTPSIRNVLIERLRRRRDLQVVIVLPRETEEPFIGTAITQRQADIIHSIEAASAKITPRTRRVHVLALAKWNASTSEYEGIYVHAKVAIVDDNWMTIGSANTFARSFEYDTELNVFTDDVKQVVALRRRLWSEHLELDKDDDLLKDPLRAIRRMTDTADANGKMKSGALKGRLVPMTFKLPPFWLRPLYDNLADEFL